MIKDLYSRLKIEQSNSIGTAALIVAFFGITSRLLGLIRDRILAAHYGAGDVLDIYYAAFRIPDLIFELIIVGSLAAAFVPRFSMLIVGDDYKRAWRCANDLLLTLLGALGILSLLGFIFAPFLIHLIVPGFGEEKIAETTKFARLMFLSPLFLTISALLGSILVSMKKFILYASAPLLYNIGIIFGIVFIAPSIGPIGLAWGVVLGAILHFIIHVFAAYKVGFTFEAPKQLPYKNKDVQNILSSMVPRVFGSASNQISLLMTTFSASLLSSGALTIFTFAYNIQSVILGIVGVSFALAAFPTLSAAHAAGKDEYFSEVFVRTLRRILYYAIPLSVLFWVLRAQIIRLVYGAGNFDKVDTAFTISVLGILLISLFAQCITPLLARAFYAMHDTKTPLYAALFAQVVNLIVLYNLFMREFRIEAIAIAFTVAAMTNAFVLLVFLKWHLPQLPYRDTFFNLGKITIAAFFSGGVAHMTKNFIGTFFEPQIYVWQYLVQFGVTFTVGITMFLGLSALFKLKEFETIKKNIFLRLFGRPIVAAEEQHQGTVTH